MRGNGDVNTALDNILGEADRRITRTPVVESKLRKRRDKSHLKPQMADDQDSEMLSSDNVCCECSEVEQGSSLHPSKDI